MSHLGLFAKFWTPGNVKTRLAATIGDRHACEVYRLCLFHLLEQLKSTGTKRSVVYSPSSSQNEFREAIDNDWGVIPQSDGDLGMRMKTFFCEHFDQSNPGPAIIIGADCPLLNSAMIQAAFDQLETHDVVIGPSLDGGYYLIGMRDRCFDVFDQMTWSTPDVFFETEKRMQHANCNYKVLPTMFDVDDHDTLMKLVKELNDPSNNLPETFKTKLLKVISLDSRSQPCVDADQP